MPITSRLSVLAVASAIALTACGGSEAPPPAAAPTVATAAPPPPLASAAPAPVASQTREEAHKLVVLAASCWFGGFWADALGELDQMKQAGVEARCHDLERRVWETDDQTHFEQLRALEAKAAADVVAKVDTLARGDSVDGARREALVNLTTALAEAQKETMLARRAGERVKRDLDQEPEKLGRDEVDAVVPLRSIGKVEALYKLEAGDLSREARALALLCGLDRVEIARGLPKHLKLYAVADEFKLFFGVTVPDVPADGSKKLVPGTWLKFLSETARAAGHPVSDKAKTPREKDVLAWTGMLEGFSDKLKAEADGVAGSMELSKVVAASIYRLELESRAAQTAEGTKPTKMVPTKKK